MCPVARLLRQHMGLENMPGGEPPTRKLQHASDVLPSNWQLGAAMHERLVYRVTLYTRLQNYDTARDLLTFCLPPTCLAAAALLCASTHLANRQPQRREIAARAAHACDVHAASGLNNGCCSIPHGQIRELATKKSATTLVALGFGPLQWQTTSLDFLANPLTPGTK